MGTPRELMPDPTTPKYGSREHAEARGLLGDVWDRVQRRSSGTPSSAHALGRPAPGTKREAAEASRSIRRSEQNEDMEIQQDEDRTVTSVPRTGYAMFPDGYDEWEDEAPCFVPEPPAEVLQTPWQTDIFWRWILPQQYQGLSDEDKWKTIFSLRNRDRPARKISSAWTTHPTKVARAACPDFRDRCLTCGEWFHSSIDRFFCEPEKAKCIYPSCQPQVTILQKADHNIKVCRHLQHGCVKCMMRGHHPDFCPGKTVADKEESRRLFEEFADFGINTSKRRENPYLGFHFFHNRCFARVVCPWKYEELLAMTIPELEDKIQEYVTAHSGPGSSGSTE
jgi:hypothetical protein